MKAPPKDDRSWTDHRDHESTLKRSSHKSRRRRSVEFQPKYSSRGEEVERIDRDHRQDLEGRSRRRSRSRPSRGDRHIEPRQGRELRRESDNPSREAYSERKEYSYHRRGRQSDRINEPEERTYREYYQEGRAYKPAERNPYPPPNQPEEFYDHHHRAEHHQTYHNSKKDFRRGSFTHRSHKSEHSRRQLSPHRQNRHQKEELKNIQTKDKLEPSNRSLSPDASLEPSAVDKLTKSSRRSSKQKSRTLRHLKARKAAQDFFRQLSTSPSRENTEQSGAQSPSRPAKSADHQPSRNSSPKRSNPDSSNVSLHEEKVAGMNSTNHGPRRGPGSVDTRQQYAAHASQYGTPNNSHHGSPHSGSSYGRPGWGGGGYYAQQQQ